MSNCWRQSPGGKHADIPAALAAEAGRAVLGNWGIEAQYIDPSINPGDDFYRYVNEGWLTSTKIPDGFAYANAFVDASLNTEKQLDELIAGIVASDPAPGSDEALVKAMFQSYLDVDRLNALGLAPIKDDVAAMLAVTSYDEVARWMARPFTASVIGIGVGLDPGQPKRYVPQIMQSGLGLPSPEYYLLPGEPFVGHRTAYRDYIEATFKRAGVDDPRGRADAILALETQIAALHWTQTEMRDPIRMYHLMKTDELKSFAPEFNWTVFLDEKKFGDQAEIVIGTDTAVQNLAKLVAATPVEIWRSYLAFHYIDRFLGGAVGRMAAGAFRVLLAPPRRHCAAATVEGPRHLVCQPHARRAAGARLRQAVFPAGVSPADGKAGRQSARRLPQPHRPECLDGYRDPQGGDGQARRHHRAHRLSRPLAGLTAVRLDATDLAGNVRAVSRFNEADSLAALTEPRRDWQWPYSPQTVNAGYDPSLNSITFPAAILQPPFFDPDADPAVNYGAIGAVIGHELGHAFDDQGSRQDADGALRNWWTDASRSEFDRRAAVLVDQYNQFSPIEGMHVNGALTLGENIGDVGGLTVAYDAYRLSVEQELGRAPDIEDFSGDQRFFLAWAQVWRTLATPDALRQLVLSDPHSPGQFRTNGVVRNVDAWYAAFGVKEGDALYLPPDKRAKIW